MWLRSDGSSTGQQRYDEDASHDVCGRKECGIVACNERGEGQRLEDRDRMEMSAQRQVRASIVKSLSTEIFQGQLKHNKRDAAPAASEALYAGDTTSRSPRAN